jgi:hypothetical protein
MEDRNRLIPLAAGLIAGSAILYIFYHLVFHDQDHTSIFALH